MNRIFKLRNGLVFFIHKEFMTRVENKFKFKFFLIYNVRATAMHGEMNQ